MATPSYLEVEILVTAREVIVSLLLMGLALFYNGFMFTQTLFFYKRVGAVREGKPDWRQIMVFMSCTLLLALTQFGAVTIWAASIYFYGLIPSWDDAFLFTGSCYTSMGIYGNTLPPGWRMLSLSIAFTGLFSFGWATAATISMISDLKRFVSEKT